MRYLFLLFLLFLLFFSSFSYSQVPVVEGVACRSSVTDITYHHPPGTSNADACALSCVESGGTIINPNSRFFFCSSNQLALTSPLVCPDPSSPTGLGRASIVGNSDGFCDNSCSDGSSPIFGECPIPEEPDLCPDGSEPNFLGECPVPDDELCPSGFPPVGGVCGDEPTQDDDVDCNPLNAFRPLSCDNFPDVDENDDPCPPGFELNSSTGSCLPEGTIIIDDDPSTGGTGGTGGTDGTDGTDGSNGSNGSGGSGGITTITTTNITNNSDGSITIESQTTSTENPDNTSASASSNCSVPPTCSGSPIECAQLQQAYNFQCLGGVTQSSDCTSQFTCTLSDRALCAIAETNYYIYCSRETPQEDIDSLNSFLEGTDFTDSIDDGSYFYGDLSVDGEGGSVTLESIDLDENIVSVNGTLQETYSLNLSTGNVVVDLSPYYILLDLLGVLVLLSSALAVIIMVTRSFTS